MEEKTKVAYRHLLYVAMIDMRNEPLKMPSRGVGRLFSGRNELRRVRALANCFHNLAAYSVQDFEGFNEAMFWSEIEIVKDQFGDYAVERYRRIFDAYLRGEVFIC